MSVTALQHIRRMRGGAQAHLMRCSDRFFYVVKFQNNPQGVRILANEIFASRIAAFVGLPVPSTEIIEVDDWLIDHTPELRMQLAHGSTKCLSGAHFGSRYAVDPLGGQVFDYMPVEFLHSRVRNLEAFFGMLALDKWTGNMDARQVAYWRRARERHYTAAFIDHGHCFNAERWTFPDDPLRGVYAQNEVYATVRNWESFTPWLVRIETFPPKTLRAIADEIPCEWYERDRRSLDQLIEELIARRSLVRDLIERLRFSSRRPFPCWAESIHARSMLKPAATEGNAEKSA